MKTMDLNGQLVKFQGQNVNIILAVVELKCASHIHRNNKNAWNSKTYSSIAKTRFALIASSRTFIATNLVHF